jgi:DNA uptake protein ComE-like DNA-binding protein
MRNSLRRSSCPYIKKGSIIVISLWVLVFFSIMGVVLFKMVCAQIGLVKRLEGTITGEDLARSAVVYARQERESDTPPYDTLYKLKQERVKELGGDKFIYTLSDEESKININNSSSEVLARLPGFSNQLAQAVANYSLKPFHFKEELMQVEGFTQEVFNSCKDFVTTYSNGKVNINTAPKEVLTALGLDQSLAEDIEAFRKGPDGVEGTEDDGFFETTAQILDKMRAFCGLSQQQEAALLELSTGGTACVSSENLSVNIKAYVAGKSTMQYAVVFNKDKIKQWSEW